MNPNRLRTHFLLFLLAIAPMAIWVSYRAQSKLEWDAENLKATNCPAADNFIQREYRQGWTL